MMNTTMKPLTGVKCLVVTASNGHNVVSHTFQSYINALGELSYAVDGDSVTKAEGNAKYLEMKAFGTVMFNVWSK